MTLFYHRYNQVISKSAKSDEIFEYELVTQWQLLRWSQSQYRFNPRRQFFDKLAEVRARTKELPW
jgi:hypothetical protein